MAPAAYLLADTFDADGANTDDEYLEEDEDNLEDPGVARVLAAEANRRSRSEVRRLDIVIKFMNITIKQYKLMLMFPSAVWKVVAPVFKMYPCEKVSRPRYCFFNIGVQQQGEKVRPPQIRFLAGFLTVLPISPFCLAFALLNSRPKSTAANIGYGSTEQ